MLKTASRAIKRPVLIGSTIAAVAGFACLTKELLGGQRYQGIGIKVKDKVFIVTGANTGIGKQTAWEFAARGAKVYMACRDLKRCEETREQIVLRTKNKYVYCRKCDLASLGSIREFVKVFKSEQKRLDVLVNNAGVMDTSKTQTREGFETQLGVNHMGHFLLTNLLLDYLKESAPSRIINVSCVAYKKGKINKGDLNSDKNYKAKEAYAQSKLANVLITRELANKLQGTGVTVNAVNPGLCDTDITRHMSFYSSWLATIFVKPFIWPFIKDSTQGAQTVIYLALDKSVEKVTGKYFCNYEEEEVSEEAKDEKTAKWLWAVSEKWTRLDQT